ITNDLSDYRDANLTADTGSMVTVQVNRVSNIWSAPDGDVSHARQLTHGSNKYDGEVGLQWTPDGKIVYTSITSFAPNVWIMNGDGGNPRQLTQNDGRYPAVSPDGRYIVFNSQQAGTSNIWRMDADGGNSRQLTDNGGLPSVSPDGR